jgi:DNA-binding ferritin-like protein
MTAEKLLAVMFLSREVAHRVHWSTKGPGSFSQHMALGDFYDGIVDHADKIAEAYMGRYGSLDTIPFMDPSKAPTKDNIDDLLEDHMDMIEEGRYEACEKDDTPLQNLIDSAIELYLSTLYKLRNLK